MLELGVLFVVLAVGAAAAAVVAMAGLAIKLLFKLLVLPLLVAGWLLKGVLAILAGLVLLLFLGPAVLAVALVVLLPILAVAGLIWGAVTVLSAA